MGQALSCCLASGDRATSRFSFSAPEQALNDGGPWHFFLSHKQKETGRAMALITRDLERAGFKVWLDVNMNNCSEEAMMEGVDFSKFFLCVLSPGYFDSKFCKNELRRAICRGKRIILCHGEGVDVGKILQRKPLEFESIGAETSIQIVVSDPTLRETSVKQICTMTKKLIWNACV